LTEEKPDNIGARLERSPRKSLAKLAQEADVSVSSARTATELLKLRPYKMTSAFITTKRLSYNENCLQLVYPISN
jgi:hypothetical protein